METTTGFSIDTLLTYGTNLVTWLISAMTSFLGFMTTNSATLVWFFVSLALLGLKCIRKFF